MKKIIGTALLLSSLILTFIAVSHVTPAGTHRIPGTDHTASGVPVLVELFTSEGCSDCPPADALLAKLEELQPISGAQIIALEEHVDYWDEQGWRDPFSSEKWTERQQNYASARQDQSIYTPQMVIDGHAVFVGSREHQARQEIKQALRERHAEISLVALPSNDHDAAQVDVSVGSLEPGGDPAEVWLAITETGLQSGVTRGENAGHNLRHAAVVRILRKLGTADRNKAPSYVGPATVRIVHGWNQQNLRAVVFVQENHSRHVLGSAALAIRP